MVNPYLIVPQDVPGNMGHWCQDLSSGKIETECKVAGPWPSEVYNSSYGSLASTRKGVQGRKGGHKYN